MSYSFLLLFCISAWESTGTSISLPQASESQPFMRRSIRKFNNPPGIWTFEDWLVQIPSPWGKKAVQMPHQSVLNCLSSKTNLVFNQALYMPFRERDAVMTPSIFFWRPFSKSYSLTKAKFYLVNPSDPAKTEKIHGPITSEQEVNLVQIPHPSNATFKFPPPRARCTVKCPGYARGGGMLKFRIDRHINLTQGCIWVSREKRWTEI